MSTSSLHLSSDSDQSPNSNAPKYRLVVRFSNKNIVVQIVYARLQGDFVLTAAQSRELPKYGINHGLTNWAAGMSDLECTRKRISQCIDLPSLCDWSACRKTCSHQAGTRR